jgi:hypothetical protein
MREKQKPWKGFTTFLRPFLSGRNRNPEIKKHVSAPFLVWEKQKPWNTVHLERACTLFGEGEAETLEDIKHVPAHFLVREKQNPWNKFSTCLHTF